MTDVAPAIAVGNTIVVKPAEDAPLTCLLLAKLALEAGIPPGVVNVVTGYGTEAGAALPLHPLVRRMSFTGSPETGLGDHGGLRAEPRSRCTWNWAARRRRSCCPTRTWPGRFRSSWGASR